MGTPNRMAVGTSWWEDGHWDPQVGRCLWGLIKGQALGTLKQEGGSGDPKV